MVRCSLGVAMMALSTIAAEEPLCSAGFDVRENEGWTAGSILASTTSASVDGCCSFCLQNEQCAAWTWKASDQNCYITSEPKLAKKGKNKISGLRGPVPPAPPSPSPPPTPPVPPVPSPSPTPPAPSPVTPPLGFQPNILLLFPDQWRFDWDGLHSNASLPLRMPNMRKYAALGTRFEKAYVPSPLCAPSRAALASGREYDLAHMGGNHGDYDINLPTFYTQLQRAGYHTIMTGKDDLTKGTQLGWNKDMYLPDGRYHMAEMGISDGIRQSGKEDVVNKYPLPHEPYGFYLNNQTVQLEDGTPVSAWEAHHSCFTKGKLCQSTSFGNEVYEDDWTTANAITLLDRKPAGVPWFMQVSFPGPHPPFIVTSRMADSVTDRTWPLPEDGGSKSTCDNDASPGEPGLRDTRCNYAAELENLDRLFGDIVDKVKSLGELEQTLVCISSDHGEMLGDHHDDGKMMPWEGSVAVPLLCFGGSPKLRVEAEAVRATPVATLDLAGTFLDYAGTTVAEGMSTQSLRPLLEGPVPYARDTIASGYKKWRLVVEQHQGTWFKFVCCEGTCRGAPSNAPKAVGGWHQLLYDVQNDPFDMHDLSAQYPEIVSKMRPSLPETFGCGGTIAAVV